MSTYKNIAVVGAGLLGGKIVKGLVSHGANVLVIIRPDSSTKESPASAQEVRVSYTDTEALAAAFTAHKTEVVVSTLGAMGMMSQIPIADAAETAGVKLFVPSEFGFPTDDATEGPLGDKRRVAEHLANIGLPSTRVYTGVFATYYPWLTGLSDDKIQIIGAGNQKITFTNLDDVAGYVAYVVTHVPHSKLANKILRIQGEAKTLLEVAALYGDKAKVVFVDKLDDAFADGLQRFAETGKGSSGYDGVSGRHLTGEDAAGAANALWEGHEWITIKESLSL